MVIIGAAGEVAASAQRLINSSLDVHCNHHQDNDDDDNDDGDVYDDSYDEEGRSSAQPRGIYIGKVDGRISTAL